ncbi:MAG: PKD domain-containing protein [Acidimicrobiia bacterium]
MGTWGDGFDAAFVDVDEWREEPRRHRYVHGGFEGTHTRFSFYFPPAEHYRGRFFQYLEGGAGGHESLLATSAYEAYDWIFDLAYDQLGGYLVESNQGHFHNEGTGFADDVELFGASAASARYARSLAAEMYGAQPHHGYVWGQSGGGSRSIYCIENAPDVYDGASPHVITSGGLTQQWSAVSGWWLHARDRLPEIVDAASPGGSGDPFEHLSDPQREALAAVYRLGYPRGAESQLWSFAPWLWSAFTVDPQYLHDFWDVPGYLGHDSPACVAHLVVDRTAKVTKVIRLSELGPNVLVARIATAGAASDQSYGIDVDADFPDRQVLFGSKLTVVDGKAAGRVLYVSGASRSMIMSAGEMNSDLFDGVEVGDEVHIDNRDFIAWSYFHRYNLGLDGYSIDDPTTGTRTLAPEFGGLRAWTVDGVPVFPQRPPLATTGGGTGHTGRFTGKVIHVNATHDSMVWPTGVAAYARKVRDHQGDATDAVYRLWWVENAGHGAPEFIGPMVTAEKDPGVWRSRLVSYDGVTSQALRDLVAWTEEGTAPPATTGHRFTDDGGLVLAADPAERAGVQPLAAATADGGARATVSVGEPVRFAGSGEMTADGAIVQATWDFEGTGRVDHAHQLSGRDRRVDVEVSHAYPRPGTYFASFRVAGHRDGADGAGRPAENLARVRVVVRA